MMNYSTTLATRVSKHLGILIMMVFAFVAFAHGQSEFCTTPRWTTLSDWASTLAYSATWAEFPESCDQLSATLSCNNGTLDGNRQVYSYASCIQSWALVPWVDLSIDQSPVRSEYLIAQWSSPEFTIIFYNNGTSWIALSDVAPELLTCAWRDTDININVYSSKTLKQFSLAPGTKLGVNIRIQPIFTQALGQKTMVCRIDTRLVWSPGDILSNNSRTGTFEVVEADRFDLALSQSIESISQNLEAAEWAKGTAGLQNFLFNKIMNVLVPLVIIIGILSAILGFYKLMFSSDENATKEWTRYIVFWIIGIILIMSAKFIGQNVYDMLVTQEIVWRTIAQWLYENIFYPFIKLAIYLVLGAMFVLLVSRVITFIFGSDADAQKKAGTLIGRNIISMLIIIGAKQIVEVIYGKQEDVMNANVTNLWEIGSWVLADKHIPILYQVINYALGIASLVILVIIIIQTVKLLMKPDDPAQIKNIKNSLLYMFIGILILWAGYLIVNFAIIN